MKTLRELFEREMDDTIWGYHSPYSSEYTEWLEKGVEKQYAIRDKLIRNLMKENKELNEDIESFEVRINSYETERQRLEEENKELKKEIQHVKDVWIGISDAKDLIIKRLEKELDL
jgi:peptidoglycan hydrolase CwlO-like protein